MASQLGKADDGLAAAAERAKIDAKKKSKPNASSLSKAEKEAFALDFEVCHALVKMPAAVGRDLSNAFAPDPIKKQMAQIWEDSPELSSLAGRSLHVLAIRHGEEWIEHAPAIILGVCLGGGLLIRGLMTWKLLNEFKKLEARAPGKAEPND